jgi:erythromycin esterase-like protein
MAVRSEADLLLVQAIRHIAQPLDAFAPDYDAVLEHIGDAQFVLLGEATHGTHEFYQERARITERLIVERGFTAVALEADWPDAYRVNRYIQGESADRDAEESLRDFKRFPSWMWRNADFLDFVGWLREYNKTAPADQRPGVYGLDLYSLFSSIEAVVRYLDRVDAPAAARARARYACFDHFYEDSQAYGYAATAGLEESCEQEVVAQLVELQKAAAAYASRDGRPAEDEFFVAEQNARLAMNAEEYYRSMFRGRVSSWNLRDQHMVDTLDALVQHLGRRRPNPKVVVWAHNSHLGNAGATEMGRRGELNVGQLVKNRFGAAARLIGFTTHDGTVTAASEWDSPAELKRVKPSLPGSIEQVLHETEISRFFLDLRGHRRALDGFQHPYLQRAIGVIYRPETERMSHYFETRLLEQFDSVIHIDRTRAVEPLERSSHWSGESADTYPTGL